MKEKYYERLKALSKDPNSSMLFWGYEASAILKEIERLNKMLEEKFMKEYTFIVENGIICKKNKEIERLNNIINKAIEYLESYNTDFKNCRFGEAPISMRELGDLLDILKGSDKE